MLNRIEEVKNKIDDYMGKSSSSNKASKQYDCARQICQLFPQPLDDKELREKIGAILCLFGEDCNPKYCGSCGHFKKGKCEDPSIAEILALLQPKIEEAKREERERIIDIIQRPCGETSVVSEEILRRIGKP